MGDSGHKIAYIFDAIDDKEDLREFKDRVSSLENEDWDNEPTVMFTFKAYRDREELNLFQKSTNYACALDELERYLHNQKKYLADGVSDETKEKLEEIWSHFCQIKTDWDLWDE